MKVRPKISHTLKALIPMAWPQADQLAWQRAVTPGDPFDPRTRASRWSKGTRAKAELVYGKWLAWLLQEGLLKPELMPLARVTSGRLKRFIAWLRLSTAPWTVYGQINVLYTVLSLMTPGKNWQWLKTICHVLRRHLVSTRYLPQRIRPSRELMQYGIRLMAEAEASIGRISSDQAIQFRDGLMIALLAARPIRLANFAAIQIGKHLLPLRNGYQLVFRARETKTSRPIQFDLPTALVPLLNRYLTHHRPVLVGSDGWWKRTRLGGTPPTNALWVSSHGTALSLRGLAGRVVKLTKREFGVVISPHLFRHCAATSIAIEDPENIRIASIILGHNTFVTVERSYNQASTVEAARRYHEIILKLRPAMNARRHPSRASAKKRASR